MGNYISGSKQDVFHQYRGKIILLFAVIMLLILISPGSSYAQYFGQNKVNYENYDWLYIQTENFDIYYPKGSYDIAEYAGWMAEESLTKIQDSWNYQLQGRIIFVVFPSHNAFQNNNVGGGSPSESTGGFTEFLKNRVVIPYQGSHEVFRHVVHHELTHAVMLRMLFGEGVQSILTGMSRLPIPLWYIEGLAEYESNSGWDNDADMYIRDAIINDYLMPLQALRGYFIYKGGQSFLTYLHDRYGPEKVGELTRQIRNSRDFDTALKKVIGVDLEEISKRWHKYLKKQIWPTASTFESPEDFAVKLTDHEEWYNFINTSPALSPDGDRMAILSDKQDYMSIYLVNTVSGEIEKKIISGSGNVYLFEQLLWLRPWIDWSPDGQEIAFVGEAGGEDALYTLNVETGKITNEIRFGLEGVFSPSWSPDGQKIAFSGHTDGESDIYIADLKNHNNVTKITDDVFSDYDPDWGKNGNILFVSDRGDYLTDPSNPVNVWEHSIQQLDVYIIDPESHQIERITADKAEDRSPTWTSEEGVISYVSDKTGAYNLYLENLDTGENWATTNVLTGVFTPSWSDVGTVAFTSYYNAGYDIYLYKTPFDSTRKLEPGLTYFQQKERQILDDSGLPREPIVTLAEAKAFETEIAAKKVISGEETQEEEIEEEAKEEEEEVKIVANNRDDGNSRTVPYRNYVFYPEGWRNYNEPKEVVNTTPDSIWDENGKFIERHYKLKFSPDIVAASAGYSNFFGLQGYGQIMFSDVLGDHIIFLNTDLYYNFENSNFAIYYYNLPNRLDFGGGAFHNVYFFNYNSSSAYRDRNYGLTGSVSYPFSRTKRLSLSGSFINIDRDVWNWDKRDYESQRKLHFVLPNIAYVYDNTIWGWTGPMNGHRYRIGFSFSPKLSEDGFTTNDTSFTTSGSTVDEMWGIDFKTVSFDARKYFHVGLDYSLAFRVSGASSWGETPEQFFLGGVNNWINRRFKGGYIRDDLNEVYFSGFATPLRGADYYEKYGNRYLLVNNEFRFPFIRQMLFGWPLPFFFYNVRGAMFMDVGAAWTNMDFRGTSSTPNGNTQFEDIVMGYGWGWRLNLGIFMLKWDMAWRNELYRVSKPRYYVSLGTDL